jgi:hypothetical protein
MPAAFHHLARRLRDSVLPAGDPFKVFLDEHADWLEELQDVRDDICHRTTYGRVRTGTFPDALDVMRAGGSIAQFLSGPDLRGYVGELFRRVLALSCVAETFVYSGILKQHPERAGVPPAIVLADDGFDPSLSTAKPLYPLGTIIMTLGHSSLEDLEYFLGSASH